MFVALIIQQAMRMRRIILPSVACLALPYFSTLSHKLHDFRKKKKVTEYKMCVLTFSTNFVWNISHSRKNSARRYHKCTQFVTYITCDYSQILIILQFFRHIFEKYSNFTKVHPVAPSCSTRTADTAKLTVAFRKSAKTLKLF